MRILFLSRWYPFPANNGAKIRIFNLLKQLATIHEVALISFADASQADAPIGPLGDYCSATHAVPYRQFQPNRLTAITALLSSRPRSVVDTYNKEMEQKVRTVAASFKPDLVIASQIDMAPYADLVPHARRILEELELTVLREAVARGGNPITRLRRALTWQKHSRYVAKILRHFDGCTVVSEEEYQQVMNIARSTLPIKIVANGVDTAQMGGSFGLPTPNTLIYTGALSYDANLDAMYYFVQEIFPLILAENPEVELKITGSIKGVAPQALPTHARLTLTGYIDDLRPTVAQSYVSIVPLRIGGGTRLKILESLALGTPVITTRKGIEGLKIAPGAGVLIADTPAEFASAVQQVLHDPDLRQQLSAAGQAAVQRYDWQYIRQPLLSLIDEIMLPMPQRQLWNAA